jgi:hypothetical protein
VFQKLVSHNDDLRHLVDKGYAVAFDSTNHLIIRDIPYLGPNRELKTGAIVAKLEFIDEERVKQVDHQIFFAGTVPHGLDGNPIPNLGGGLITIMLSDSSRDVIVERSFSNKPRVNGVLEGFPDFFANIESYVAIISGPAVQLHDVNPYTFRAVREMVSDSVFKFNDTLTSRAEIGDLAAKLENDVVAVIGLGGTGAYLLDFLVKSRVREIRGFDADAFHIHNAYRAPGKTDPAEFSKSKVEVLQARYDNFRTGLYLKRKFVDESCTDDLAGVTFAFVCVDKGSSRAGIINLLISLGILFIDVGIGLKRKSGALKGMLRSTYFPADQSRSVLDMGLVEMADAPDDIYRTNIQIGELNALNACLAIIQFKKLRGFYLDEVPVYHQLFNIGESKLYGESLPDEN